jgi:hypothetical protein
MYTILIKLCPGGGGGEGLKTGEDLVRGGLKSSEGLLLKSFAKWGMGGGGKGETFPVGTIFLGKNVNWTVFHGVKGELFNFYILERTPILLNTITITEPC